MFDTLLSVRTDVIIEGVIILLSSVRTDVIIEWVIILLSSVRTDVIIEWVIILLSSVRTDVIIEWVIIRLSSVRTDVIIEGVIILLIAAFIVWFWENVILRMMRWFKEMISYFAQQFWVFITHKVNKYRALYYYKSGTRDFDKGFFRMRSQSIVKRFFLILFILKLTKKEL